MIFNNVKVLAVESSFQNVSSCTGTHNKRLQYCRTESVSLISLYCYVFYKIPTFIYTYYCNGVL